MSSRVCMLAASVALAACQPLSPRHLDGGTAGGSGATGGGGTAGGAGGAAGGTGGSAGASGGASGGAGGSAGSGGGTATFSFGAVQLPTVTAADDVVGIATTAQQTWVLTGNGVLFQSTDGGTFGQVSVAPRTSFALYAAPDGAVFLGQAGALTRCLTNCATAPSFNSDLFTNSTIDAVCGSSSSDVYGLGNDATNNAFLVHWNGSSTTTVSPNLGVTFGESCWLAPNGTLSVGARHDLLRFTSNTAYPQTLDLTALASNVPSLYWYGVAGFGSTLFAVGSRATMARQTGTDTWALVTPLPFATGDLRAVIALSATEFYAGGTDSSAGTLWASDGATWARTTTPLSGMLIIRAMAARGTNELFLGGADGSSNPLLLHAVR